MATSPDAGIAEAIAEVARALPSAQLRALADAVERCTSANAAEAGGVAGAVSTPAFAGFAARLIDAWNREGSLNGTAIATALRAAGRAAAGERELEEVEVVWTGPAPPGVLVRLTSAVIADVAASARSNLLLMSYAAYKVPAVIAALEAACERGVQVDLVLESEAASGGKLRFDARKAFGDVAERASGSGRSSAGPSSRRATPCCTRRRHWPTRTPPSSPVRTSPGSGSTRISNSGYLCAAALHRGGSRATCGG